MADRSEGLYLADDLSVAHDVRKWCIERGGKASYRIVLAGYYEEHKELLDYGWRVHRWVSKGGYSNQDDCGENKNRYREALFFSPHCLGQAQMELGI